MRELIERLRVKTSVYDQLITNPDHKPGKIAALFKKELGSKIGKVMVKEARTTMPTSWDYGTYVLFNVKCKDGEDVGGALTLYVGRGEVSGNVKLDAPRGVVALSRGRTVDKVIKEMASDTRSNLGS